MSSTIGFFFFFFLGGGISEIMQTLWSYLYCHRHGLCYLIAYQCNILGKIKSTERFYKNVISNIFVASEMRITPSPLQAVFELRHCIVPHHEKPTDLKPRPWHNLYLKYGLFKPPYRYNCGYNYFPCFHQVNKKRLYVSVGYIIIGLEKGFSYNRRWKHMQLYVHALI